MTDKTENKPTFEEAMKHLEAIVRDLQSGSAPLEKSLALFKDCLLYTSRLRRADGSEVAVEGGTDKLDLLFLSGDTCFDYEAFQSGVTEAQRRNIMANELLEDGYILALRASDGGPSPVFEPVSYTHLSNFVHNKPLHLRLLPI